MQRLVKFIILIFLQIPYSVNAQLIKTLDFFVTMAKENSPVLNDFNNQRYSLKIDSMKILADYGFKINSVNDATYAPVANGWGYDNALSNGQNVTAVIRISKDLSGRKNLNTRLLDYSLGVKQLFNQARITELQLVQAVTQQYINTYAAQQQYQNSQEVIKLLKGENIILKKLTRNAVFKQTDYLSFMVMLQQNILTSQQMYASWLNSYATLNYISGIVDTTLQKVEPVLLSNESTISFENSIYADNYKIDSLKLVNQAKIIRNEYRPKLSAYADGGYSSSFIITPYKNFGASVGLSLSVPLYDGNKQNKMLQQNHLQQETRRRYNDFERNQYKQQVGQIQNQIKQYRQMIATANEQLKYSKTLIDANLKQLPTGDVKVTDFILSINNYINLKSGLIQFETTLYNFYNTLNNLTIQ